LSELKEKVAVQIKKRGKVISSMGELFCLKESVAETNRGLEGRD